MTREMWRSARDVLTILGVGATLSLSGGTVRAYEDAVEQWRPAVEEACATYGCSTDYVLGVLACESGGNPDAVSAEVNRETGTHDLGLFQINYVYWGYFTPIEQIYFAAEHLTAGDVMWACA